ncbi:MAG: redoxin family protein, partial [Bryobacteraceae bacterium]
MRSVKTDRFLKIAIAALLAVLVYVIYDGLHERVVAQGDSAPAFTVVADSGATIGVPNFGGKVLVLNFWATWCPPCVQETP